MTLQQLNLLEEEEAVRQFMRCCGSSRWARAMVAHRPYDSLPSLHRAAEEFWWRLTETDWKEAFTHHPRIGDVESLRKKFASTAQWAAGEQTGVQGADEQVLAELTEGNRDYEKKFGYIFIVYATGKSAEEMLALLRLRLPNDLDTEIRIAAAEQAKITQLRLHKLLADTSG